ncbi:metalloregulator ArsR/SmtB family transcription factor [Photobacterium damselae subsp. damselae]|uniref:metalloregulator ArsR/SmtB family transcription factor n=1 Tax=Photobacterium damselae TaxID=38293 RepID=UPI000A2FCFC9|nr:metalloregulator ArsR/SmtB family transcription factor [Photobacterium damselae]ARR49101.1 phosphotyrosine protein phosphatase [Photobacterium damselae subsp. damselae]QAY36347.1 metalloregulator ArsR/SmtB family transcription factor [Photobacterium damselae subsp. damselae]QOQ70003.1 metalloregulator ArsR/SmtB family transcription factor [Photobacterium damselae subsp. damselae]
MIVKRILFLCTGNSARSQLAEGLMRHMCREQNITYQVASAGVKPEGVDHRVAIVLAENGIDSDDLISQSVDEYRGQHFDVVITLCDKANNECALFDNSEAFIHWDFKDPKSEEGIDGFRRVFNELKGRIALFLLLNGEDSSDVWGPVELFKVMSDPLRLRILMLLVDEKALSVSDLTSVLEVSQPKVSRHLALLRDSGILQIERQGLWIFYQLSNQLPIWIKHTLDTVRTGNPDIINHEKKLLRHLGIKKKN